MASTVTAVAALGRICSTPNLHAVSSSSTSSPVARLATGSKMWSASPPHRLRSIVSLPLMEVKSRFKLGTVSNLFASENDLTSTIATQVGGANNGRGCRGVVSMAKMSVGDLKESDLNDNKVFVRVDLKVPLDENQNIIGDTHIKAVVPTIKHLIGNGAKVILTSHLTEQENFLGKSDLVDSLGIQNRTLDLVHIATDWALIWSNTPQPKIDVADFPLKWSDLNQSFQI